MNSNGAVDYKKQKFKIPENYRTIETIENNRKFKSVKMSLNLQGGWSSILDYKK